MVKANLPNNQPVLTLCDSGATRTIISNGVVRNSPYLMSKQINNIKPVKFLIADNSHIIARQSIKFNINFQGKLTEIEALICDHLGGVDLILGTKTLKELKAVLDFGKGTLTIKAKSVLVKPTHKIKLKPGESKTLKIETKLPEKLKNAEVYFKPTNFLKKYSPTYMCIRMKRNKSMIMVCNATNKPVTISKQKHVGTVELRDLYRVMEPAIISSGKDHIMSMSLSQSKNVPRKQSLYNEKTKKYPHLEKDDERLNMTDKQIIDKKINLDKCTFNPANRQTLLDTIYDKSQAFSLHDEIGTNPNHEVSFKLENEDEFFVRPYSVPESQKPIIDRELRKLELMGVLEKGRSCYCSPIMLLSKRNSTQKRLITDFRYINQRIVQERYPFPLIRDAIGIIGHSNCKVISTIDLKSAFYSLRIKPECRKYLAITSYAGGQSYLYNRMPQGLNISPANWQSTLNEILSELPDGRSFSLGIADDLIIFSEDHKSHISHITQILDLMIKHGLKIAPEKCSFGVTDLIYMGHHILIKDGKPCITAQKDKCEAIRKLKPPTKPRDVKRFIGAVNFLSMYVKDLQKLLNPLYKLTRKNSKFLWEEIHQKNFDKIKSILQSPPVLTMPQKEGVLRMYSDSSITGTGGALFQMQNGEERLLAYNSKCMPKSCPNWSVSEIELYGILVHCHCYRYLLRNTSFEVYCDHSSLVDIMKSRHEAPTRRIQKLLEKLSGFNFKLGYVKGSDLVLTDWLSRLPNDNEDDEFLPIAFMANKTPQGERPVTRSYARQQGLNIPALHGPRSDQAKPPQAATAEACSSKEVIEAEPSVARNITPTERHTNEEVLDRQATPAIYNDEFSSALNWNIPRGYDDPRDVRETTMGKLYIPPAEESSNLKFGDKIEARQGVGEIQQTHRAPETKWFNDNKPIFKSVESEGILRKHIPKQGEIDNILKDISKRVLRDYHLPIDSRTIRKEQLNDETFKPIIKYIETSVPPENKEAAKRVLNQSENYIVINGILFRLLMNKNGESNLTLVIPDSIVPTIFEIYHGSMISMHQGVTRTFQKIRKKFYIVNLYQKLYDFIRTCTLCQRFSNPTDTEREYSMRVPTEYTTLSDISLDVKTMVESFSGYKFLAVATCNVTRYAIAEPLRKADGPSLCEFLLKSIVLKHGPIRSLTIDQDRALESKVLQYIYKALDIRVNQISPHNHGSNITERHIRTLSDFICKNLTNAGREWVRYVDSAVYSYNTFPMPSMDNMSPYYMVYLKHPRTISNLEFGPIHDIQIELRDYIEHMKTRLSVVSLNVLERQAQNQKNQAIKQAYKVRNKEMFVEGQIIYLLSPTSSSLQTTSKKLRLDWVGPLIIHEKVDPTHCILSDLEGKILKSTYHINRIKAGFIRCSGEPISNISKLREKISGVAKSPPNKIQITDEEGREISNVKEGMFVIREVQSDVNLEEHVKICTENEGIAAPIKLSEHQILKLAKVTFNKPKNNTEYEISKGRFKDGHLELLMKHPSNPKNSFWLNAYFHPCLINLMEMIANKEMHVKITGTPLKLLRKIWY